MTGQPDGWPANRSAAIRKDDSSVTTHAPAGISRAADWAAGLLIGVISRSCRTATSVSTMATAATAFTGRRATDAPGCGCCLGWRAGR
jgi:hypothetical protein